MLFIGSVQNVMKIVDLIHGFCSKQWGSRISSQECPALNEMDKNSTSLHRSAFHILIGHTSRGNGHHHHRHHYYCTNREGFAFLGLELPSYMSNQPICATICRNWCTWYLWSIQAILCRNWCIYIFATTCMSWCTANGDIERCGGRR